MTDAISEWLRDAAEYISEHGWTQGTLWNDSPERTAEDVILALKTAAEVGL